ncbi:MAG: acyl-CoA thioesterase [Burkholderiales bacterium]
MDSPSVQLPDKQPTLRVVTMPSDTNILGNIFGGWVMSQVDIAASIPAIRRARGRVATVAVNSFTFKHPIFVGDLVSFYAEVVKVGRTSISVNVEVYAQRSKKQLIEVAKVTEATLTFVALDDQLQPRVVPAE